MDNTHGKGASEWFDKTFAEQGYRCGYCGTKNPMHKHGFILEHCHPTKVWRAVVCHDCNIALGFIETHGWDAEAFVRAVRKLKEQGLVYTPES